MRQLSIAVAVTLAALVSFVAPGLAQQSQPQLPNLRPPPPAPIKPYQPVAVTPPAPLSDPGFIAFRKQLADAAAHKDRAALEQARRGAKILLDPGQGSRRPEKARHRQSCQGVGLDDTDAPGWDVLTAFANEPTAAELPHQKGVFCGPADPDIDPKAFEALGKATQTDPSEWGYPTQSRRRGSCRSACQCAGHREARHESGACPARQRPAGRSPTSRCPARRACRTANPVLSTPRTVSPLGGDQMCYS